MTSYSIGIVGATGFVGGHLQRGLVARGLDVRDVPIKLPTECRGVDDAGIEVWSRALNGLSVVINAAGVAHDTTDSASHSTSQRYIAVNGDGPGVIARAARRAGVSRFIQLSTIKVLGNAPTLGKRHGEDDPLCPSGLYASSKARGEQNVLAALSQSTTQPVIVRLPLVLGTPYKGNLRTLANAIERGIPLPLGHPDVGLRTYVHTDDLTDLMHTVISHVGELPVVLHARSTPDLRAADVAELIGAALGKRPRLVSVRPHQLRTLLAMAGRRELASKLLDPMLVSDDLTRQALGLPLRGE